MSLPPSIYSMTSPLFYLCVFLIPYSLSINDIYPLCLHTIAYKTPFPVHMEVYHTSGSIPSSIGHCDTRVRMHSLIANSVFSVYSLFHVHFFAVAVVFCSVNTDSSSRNGACSRGLFDTHIKQSQGRGFQ
ncbi:hypothetical protein BDF14DRAFT_1799976 [Spinellus fusiger]|nr:hypothetical protein BDF14DRAFT_1799976 [Spinellus fusiger]